MCQQAAVPSGCLKHETAGCIAAAMQPLLSTPGTATVPHNPTRSVCSRTNDAVRNRCQHHLQVMSQPRMSQPRYTTITQCSGCVCATRGPTQLNHSTHTRHAELAKTTHDDYTWHVFCTHDCVQMYKHADAIQHTRLNCTLPRQQTQASLACTYQPCTQLSCAAYKEATVASMHKQVYTRRKKMGMP